MGAELVTVAVSGQLFTGFKRATVRAALDEAARYFQLEIAAEFGAAAAAWTFKAGTKVQIAFNGAPVLDGYVDRYQPRIGEHSTADITVSGRSKSADLVDCSAVHDTGRFENKTVLQILQELDKFGVGITTDQQMEPVAMYQLTPGETPFRAGEKLCRSQGLTMAGQADGSLKLTKAGRKRQSGGLIEGQNIKRGEADHNWSNRHSEVRVRGQRPIGHGAAALEIEKIARDAAVDRYRPVIVVVDDDTDDGRAQKRADSRRDREAGASLSAGVTVQGFRDAGGQVWEPGNLVFTESPFLNVSQDMLIESVTWTQDRQSGSETQLSLVDPRAYGGKGGKGGSAGDAWQSGAGE